MKIRTKFYYHDRGKYFECGGNVMLEDRQITNLGKLEMEEKIRQFYYDDTLFDITYEDNTKKYKVPVNRIITESTYKTSQKEYLVKLNWLQQQKLLWMFRRHWLQQPGNVVHLFITILIISVAYIGFKVATHSF